MQAEVLDFFEDRGEATPRLAGVLRLGMDSFGEWGLCGYGKIAGMFGGGAVFFPAWRA